MSVLSAAMSALPLLLLLQLLLRGAFAERPAVSIEKLGLQNRHTIVRPEVTHYLAPGVRDQTVSLALSGCLLLSGCISICLRLVLAVLLSCCLPTVLSLSVPCCLCLSAGLSTGLSVCLPASRGQHAETSCPGYLGSAAASRLACTCGEYGVSCACTDNELNTRHWERRRRRRTTTRACRTSSTASSSALRW